MITDDRTMFKYAFYQALGYYFEFPLSKRTGFELLKQFLASETGNYDEFDQRYRFSLIRLLRSGSVHGTANFQNTLSYHGDLAELQTQLNNSLQMCGQLSDCTKYNFDW